MNENQTLFQNIITIAVRSNRDCIHTSHYNNDNCNKCVVPNLTINIIKHESKLVITNKNI